MIKRIFLTHKIKKAYVSTGHPTYKEARGIGILYNVNEYPSDTIDELAHVFEHEGKTIGQLGYTNTPLESDESKPYLFSKRDISTLSFIKKDFIDFFIRQRFDFLLSLNTCEDINYKYVLAKSHASCKIGIHAEGYNNLLQMRLKTLGERSEKIKNIIKYLKMI